MEPKLKYRKPGLDAQVLYKLPPLPLGDRDINSPKETKSLLACLQILLTFAFHHISSVMVSPGFIILTTFPRTVPSKVNSVVIFFGMFPCQLHHIVFDGLETNTPFPAPVSCSRSMLFYNLSSFFLISR